MLRPILSAVLLATAAGACFAQTSESGNSWLMQNYRFTAPPSADELQGVNPTLADLQEIQNATLSMMHKAKIAGDFEAALAAGAQAAANAQLIANLSGQLKNAHPPAAPPKPLPSHFLIALQDHTVHPASAVWADRLMLHYTTREGAHEQVRLDRVDWKLSAELNRHVTP
jgi:hypothetical protein